MLTRTRRQTITFENEFSLSGIEQTWPPGSYVVETEEELITELSFPAYRRTATMIHLSQPGCTGRHEVATIDPAELGAAIERDALLGSNVSSQSTPEIQTDMEASRTSPPSSERFPFSFAFSERFRKAAARLRSRDDRKS